MKKNKNTIRNLCIGIGVVLLLLVIAYGFVPQVLSGKVVNQGDIVGYNGLALETNRYNNAHPDDPTAWTESAFGGMPTVSFSSQAGGDWTQKIYNLMLTGKRPGSYLFISLLGGLLLMLSLGVSLPLAVGGAIAITFCAYNLQIIQVGHNTKMMAIAFMPWALAALIFTYRKALDEKLKGKQYLPLTLLGAVLFAFAVSFQIKANHQQITYYLAIIIFLYAIVLFIWLLADGDRRRALLGRFFIASGLLLVLGLVGVATNANKLLPLYQYTNYTMRGGSELVEAASDAGTAGAKGLDLDYATSWSYGWEELPNLMIPNYNGGSSVQAVNISKSETYKLLKQAGQSNLREICKALPLYWGPQPFTAGPMYMGAITIFLFLLGLLLCRGKEKWWLLASTILAVLLSLGSHFIWFTKLWYDYAPMYNKFRTVSMSLVVLQVTLPMLAFVTLDRIVRSEIVPEEFRKKGWIALALTAGFCLVCAVFPSVAGSFTNASDAQQSDGLVEAFKADRTRLLVSDAFRSLCLILASFVLIWWGCFVPKSRKKTFAAQPEMGLRRRMTAAVLVCVLVLLDIFPVAKRYLNDDHFVTARDFLGQTTTERVADKFILQDPDPSYRVLDLSGNVFSDPKASAFHKSIGGYSAAKLQRYQDLIDYYITDECNSIFKELANVKTVTEAQEAVGFHPVLSMLNCRYIILDEGVKPLRYPYAFGNAWFVDGVCPAESVQEEIGLLGSIDLRKYAIVGKDFPQAREALSGIAPAQGSIELTYYAPNELRYHYSAARECAVVFSEIYYKDGWHAWLADTPDAVPQDNMSGAAKARTSEKGVPVELFRADWDLRAAILPAGEHDLIMRCDPPINFISAGISRASSISLILILLLAVGALVYSSYRKEDGSQS